MRVGEGFGCDEDVVEGALGFGGVADDGGRVDGDVLPVFEGVEGEALL